MDHISLHRDGRAILRDVSCDIERGRHIAIVGDNGSGKSSLLRILCGELWPTRDQGRRSYALDGKSVVTSPLLVRPQIRRVAPEMQERFLRLGLQLSVFEFVASGLHDRDYAQARFSNEEAARVQSMLERMRLQTVASKEAKTLSHGMLRRAFLARALIAEPLILALDEVTDGLDAASRDLALARIDDALEYGTTLICVAHRVERLPSCVQTFYQLREGRLWAIQAPEPPSYIAAHAEPVSSDTHKLSEARALVELLHVDVMIDEVPVLFDINLVLRRGEHIAITGENGAGKSTLAGVIDGTLLAASGQVVRHGFARRPSIWEIRQQVVTLSDALQIRHDWMCSVRDTLASGFFHTIGMAEALDVPQEARLQELLGRFALIELAERNLPMLSFGQRRRVLLARALVREPAVLILDEVFDGLDRATRAMLEAELAELTQRATTLVCISHVPTDIPYYVKRRIVLACGQMIDAP